jgi:hypothetical protein
MQPPLAELEAGLELAALELEGGLPEQMAGEVVFCSQPNCGGVLRRRGRWWVCPVCGTRYGSHPGASAAGTSGPPQAHTKGARRSTWQKHTRRRAGGPEKKDQRRRQREFELNLEDAAEAMAAPPRGQAGRFPARHLPTRLRQQGFLVTRHFLDRLIERAQAQGIRFNPRTFAQDFRAAPHFRQTRPGYNTRIAVIQGLPVLYRMSGPRGLNPLLVGLLPQGALPPAVPTSAPLLRESEFQQQLEAAYRNLAAFDRGLPLAEFDLSQALDPTYESGAEHVFGWWRRRKAPARPSGPSPQPSRLRRMVRMTAPRGGPYSTIWRPPRQQVIADARAAAARLRIARNRMGQARQALNQADEAMNHEIRMSFGDFKQIDPAVRERQTRAREEFQAAEVELRAAQAAFNDAMQQRFSRAWQT